MYRLDLSDNIHRGKKKMIEKKRKISSNYYMLKIQAMAEIDNLIRTATELNETIDRKKLIFEVKRAYGIGEKIINQYIEELIENDVISQDLKWKISKKG